MAEGAAIPWAEAELLKPGRPRQYRGPELDHIAFPLGGIGTGTVSLGGPAETTSLTSEPSSTSSPASGLCASTTPRGRELSRRVVLGSSSASRTFASASAWRRPVTAGTVVSSACAR